MANQKIESNDFPADWLTDDSLRGFSKVSRTRRYRPVLSLNGTQYYFGECKTRVEAARAFDLLLKFFIAFTSKRATPNFPDDFSALCHDSALLHEGDGCLTCSKLLALEEKLSCEFAALGKSVADCASLREKEIKGETSAPRENRLVELTRNTRRRAMIKLEVLSLKNMASVNLTGLVRKLSIPKAKWTPELIAEHASVDAAFCAAQAQLISHIRNLKTALDTNPDEYTK